MFSQILQLIPRDCFEGAVEKHQAEQHARGFTSWGQFVAMLFCQLAQAKSLREITEWRWLELPFEPPVELTKQDSQLPLPLAAL